MTNFAFIMDLLKISSKKFLEIGFDRSQVSRWRHGKLRLMPGRYIVAAVSKLFWSVDEKRSQPILREVLNIWYPAQPCSTPLEGQKLLERFLTEKGQLNAEYELRREKRLGRLSQNDAGELFVALRGVESAKLRILDFLELAAQHTEPIQIEEAYPQGKGVVSFDTDFNAQLLEKYQQIFEKGYRVASVIRSDDAISNFAYSYNASLVQMLKGYASNRYFDSFSAYISELFLAVAGDFLAIEVKEEEPGHMESTVSHIYTDQERIAEIRKRIQGYAASSKVREHMGFFRYPDGYLTHVYISPDTPCYQFVRLPHFGILTETAFGEAFALSQEETAFVGRELRPMLISPAFFWDYAAVRHIFCESDIENALLKKRHQCFELSELLKRRVWMTTPYLVRQLKEIQRLLKEHKNYEVCFLGDERFEELKVQLTVWGYSASVMWLDSAHSAASRGNMNHRVIRGFCQAAWDNIPVKLKSRAAALHKIEQWLEKARRYGYEVED